MELDQQREFLFPCTYFQIHYPLEDISEVPFSEAKGQLLEAQKCELRCLLPRSLLINGFFPESSSIEANSKGTDGQGCNYSWSGHRNMPSYAKKCALVSSRVWLYGIRLNLTIFPKLVTSREDKQSSETDVRAAIWEAFGDSRASQILVDLLSMYGTVDFRSMSRNKWCSVYTRGQKQLTRRFLKKAEHALDVALSEDTVK